jgi:hypothetical protein
VWSQKNDRARLAAMKKTPTALVAHLVRAGRLALPWLILMVASTTGARAMYVGMESLAPSVEMPDTRSAPISSASERVRESRSVIVLVSFVDASGNREEFRCSTTADRVTTDSMLVNLEDVATVAANVCDAMPT